MTAAYSFFFSSGVGNIIGPLTFRDQDKPRYIPAKIAMVVSTAGAAVTLGCLVLYYKWENRRRDRLYANQDHTEDSEFLDLTDRENREFRVSHKIFPPTRQYANIFSQYVI